MNQVLADIAARLGYPTLETRNSDELDFRQIAVWSIKEALESAYEAGRIAAAKPKAPRKAKAAAPVYRPLTEGERDALAAFALHYGRGWREVLMHDYWPKAKIWKGRHELHNLRNEFGPSWLAKFEF